MLKASPGLKCNNTKESLVGHASDVCGKIFVGGCMGKGSEWWNEGVKMKVEKKKRVFEE